MKTLCTNQSVSSDLQTLFLGQFLIENAALDPVQRNDFGKIKAGKWRDLTAKVLKYDFGCVKNGLQAYRIEAGRFSGVEQGRRDGGGSGDGEKWKVKGHSLEV